MRKVRQLTILQFFIVIVLGGQADCHAKKAYPWSMFLPAVVNANADICPDEDLIADRYLPQGKNCDIIKDIVNNLEWQRCSVGQTWNSATKYCDGETASFNSWYHTNSMVLENGWRVPSVMEMRSLIYCSSSIPMLFGNNLNDTPCGGDFTLPTIYTEAFPNVPHVDNSIKGHYWTSTTNDMDSDMAWVVNFFKGKFDSDGTKIAPGLSVILVRTPTAK